MRRGFSIGVRAVVVVVALVVLASCGDSGTGDSETADSETADSETGGSETEAEPDTEQSTATPVETTATDDDEAANEPASPEDALADAEFIAVGLGNDDESLVYVSDDGTDWVDIAEIGKIGVPHLAVGEDRVLAFSSNDRGLPGLIWISEDSGLSWEQAPQLDINIVSVGYLDGAFYAAAGAIDSMSGIYRSEDGTSWELVYEFTRADGNVFEGPPGLRVFPRFAFEVGSSLGSADGTTWTEDPLRLPADATPATMSLATYAHDGSRWWSVARGAQVFSSEDGIKWEDAGNLPVNFEATGLAIAADVFVATLDNGLVYVSPDGAEWERVDRSPDLEDVEPIQP